MQSDIGFEAMVAQLHIVQVSSVDESNHVLRTVGGWGARLFPREPCHEELLSCYKACSIGHREVLEKKR